MAIDLSAVEQRAQDRLFVAHCSLAGLCDRLPLRWPTPPDTPPSPKKGYRSQYVYLGWDDLQGSSIPQHLSPFDLTLRLVDYDGVRPVLAQLLGWTSGRGWLPFDPVSFFLLQGWQISNDWSRAETLRHLHDPRYADYAQRFGFRDGCFPTEGGLRYFSVFLLHKAGVLSLAAWGKALLCPDGMLHEAASRLRCSSVSASCYEPTSPAKPRPCPAKEKERQGRPGPPQLLLRLCLRR